MIGMSFKARLSTISFLILGFTALNAQVAPTPHALVTHTASNISLDAREARPLRQAVADLRSDYGWIVDYEDPVYNPATELVDDTNSDWRARHPLEKGVTRPAGQQFKCNLISPADAQSSPFLPSFEMFSNLASAYNSSDNPGKFIVVSELDQRLAVVGKTSLSPTGLFGINVTLPIEKRTAAATLDEIFRLVSTIQGRKVVLGFASMNVLARTQVEVGGSTQTARDLLADTLTQTGVRLVWEALYDADVDTYFVNILPATQTHYGASGERIDVLIKPK